MMKNNVKYKAPTRFGAWFAGFVNGRTGTAAVGEDGKIQSGYLRSALHSYYEYTVRCRRILGESVLNQSAQIGQLLHQYALSQSPPQWNPGSPQFIRASNNSASCQRSVTHNLIIQMNGIFQAVDNYNCRVQAAAQKLNKRLSSYCKGVLFRRPLMPSNFAPLEAQFCHLEKDFADCYPILNEAKELLKKETMIHEKVG